MPIFNLIAGPLIVAFNCFLLGWITMKFLGEKAGMLVSLAFAAIYLVGAWASPLELSARLGVTFGALFVIVATSKPRVAGA